MLSDIFGNYNRLLLRNETDSMIDKCWDVVQVLELHNVPREFTD